MEDYINEGKVWGFKGVYFGVVIYMCLSLGMVWE